MPEIGYEDQTQAKEALKEAIDTLLNGGLENAVGVCGNWRANASRDVQTGYHIHLRWVGAGPDCHRAEVQQG